jgi:calcineurin-like phosphoesterase family protein
MTVYAISDMHFNHRAIIELANRPFADLDAMNTALIERWNEVVRPTDEVHVVGDFAFANNYGWDVVDIFARLNGVKHLTVGNHDTDGRNATDVLGLPWASVEQYRKVKWAKRHFVLFHYPMADWEGLARGWLHLHGHTHGNSQRFPHRFDMSVEVWNYEPVSLDDIIALAERQTAPVYGHHGWATDPRGA